MKLMRVAEIDEEMNDISASTETDEVSEANEMGGGA